MIDMAWRAQVNAERHAARRWLDRLVLEAWQRYGWVKPTGRASR